MSIISINEPTSTMHGGRLLPQSINEPIPLPDGPPVITGLNPDSAAAGGADQLVVVHGHNFVDGCVVTFSGTALETTFEREDKVNVTAPVSTMAAGEYPVVVSVGPFSSEPWPFTVTETGSRLADPDELEEEIEEAEEAGEFKSVHASRTTVTVKKTTKTKR